MVRLRLGNIVVLLAVVSIVSAGCAESKTSEASAPTTTLATPTPSATTSVEPEIGGDSTAVAEDAADSQNPERDSQIPELVDLPGIDLLTPESGEGIRPEFSWEPIDRAFFYNVVLLDPAGRGYWGWEGTTTAVHLGGEPAIKDGLSGPSVIDGMTWQVAAYDDDFNLIALSHRKPIAP